MKKIVSIILTLTLLTSCVPLTVMGAWNINDSQYATIVANANQNNGVSDIKIIINGREISFDQAPVFTEKNELVVPIRAIAEGLGSNVQWNQGNQTVIVQRGLNTTVFQIGEKKAYSNEVHTLDVEPTIIGNRTLIPLKTVSDIFGADAVYNEERNAIIINCAELNDEKILKDFRSYGFYKFNYYSTFAEEHASVNSALLTALSNIGDFGTRVFSGDILNYETDVHMENIERILGNLTPMYSEELVKAYEKDIFDKLGKASDFSYDEIKKYWEKEWSGQTFEMSGFDGADIAKFIKYFGNAMDEFGEAVDFTELSLENIAMLFADYTQQQMYIDVISKATDGSNKNLKKAVEKLQFEYSNGYAKMLANSEKTLKDKIAAIVAKKSIETLATHLGASIGLYNTAAWGIELAMEKSGTKAYTDDVMAATVMVQTASNLCHYYDTLVNEIYNINDNFKKKVSQKEWNDIINAFETTKAAYIELYKAMLEVTDNSIEKIYIKEQLDILDRFQINYAVPLKAEDMFILMPKVESTSVEGSAPGVVTSDGSHIFFPVGGAIYAEDIYGGNRVKLIEPAMHFPDGTKMLLVGSASYADLQYNGPLYAKEDYLSSISFMSGELYYKKMTEYGIASDTIYKVDLETNFYDEYAGSNTSLKRRSFDMSAVPDEEGFSVTKRHSYQKYDNKIWYIRDSSILTYKPRLEFISEDGNVTQYINNVECYCVYNGYVYFISGDGNLYRKNLKWHTEELLYQDIVNELNIHYLSRCEINTAGSCIYIYNRSYQESRLYKAWIDEYIFERVTADDESEPIITKSKQTTNETIDTNEEAIAEKESFEDNTNDIILAENEENNEISSTEQVQEREINKLDFTGDGIAEIIEKDYSNEDWQGKMYVKDGATGNVLKEFDFMTKTGEWEIVWSNTYKVPYLLTKSGFSDARDLTTVYEFKNGGFIDVDGWGVYTNKDNPYSYVQLYRCGLEEKSYSWDVNKGRKRTEEDYNSYISRYDFEVLQTSDRELN